MHHVQGGGGGGSGRGKNVGALFFFFTFYHFILFKSAGIKNNVQKFNTFWEANKMKFLCCFDAFCKMVRFTRKSAQRLPKIEKLILAIPVFRPFFLKGFSNQLEHVTEGSNQTDGIRGEHAGHHWQAGSGVPLEPACYCPWRLGFISFTKAGLKYNIWCFLCKIWLFE